MIMKKIGLCATPFSPEQIHQAETLAVQYGYTLINQESEALKEPGFLKEYEVLAGYFPKERIREAESLRWLHTPAAGVDKLLGPDMYPNPDVILTNSSGAFGEAIAEYLVCALLMLLRRMPQYLDNQRKREWRRVGPGGLLYGMTVTIVGLGDLGRTLASRLNAMGVTVRGVRRGTGVAPQGIQNVYPVCQLNEALSGADAVALCLPATPETRGLMNTAAFAAMKQGAYFLNAGRGATVNTPALINALQSGHLAGAALDVTDPEPLPLESPLWGMENVILTPHIAGSDFDPGNIPLMFDIFYENLCRYLRGEPLINQVDRARGY